MLTIDFNVKSGEHLLTATTQNISAKGLCCSLSHHIPMFTKLSICLMVPNPSDSSHEETDEVDCEGVVVRVEKEDDENGTIYRTAIFFTHIDEESIDKIENYVRAHENS